MKKVAWILVCAFGIGSLISCTTLQSEQFRQEVQGEIAYLRAEIQAEGEKEEPDAGRVSELQAQIAAMEATLAATGGGGWDESRLIQQLIESGLTIAAALGLVDLRRGSPHNRKGTAPKAA